MDDKRSVKSKILSWKFWIFDLDGTLTVPVHDFDGIRQELEVPNGEDILGFVAKQTPSRQKELLDRLNKIEVKLADISKPSEGAVKLVSILAKKGVKLGIITRNTKANARISLDKIGILTYFEDKNILGREDAPPKPDPDGINKLLSDWKAEASEAVMVGDYLFDLKAGKNAGTATIHVDFRHNGDWKDLADIQVQSLSELTELF